MQSQSPPGTEKPHLKLSTCPAAWNRGSLCNSGQEVALASSHVLVGVGISYLQDVTNHPTTQRPQIITITSSACCGQGLGRAPLLDVVPANLETPGRPPYQEPSAGAPSFPQQDDPNWWQVRGPNRDCWASKSWVQKPHCVIFSML